MYFVKLFAFEASGYGFATYSKDIGIKLNKHKIRYRSSVLLAIQKSTIL